MQNKKFIYQGILKALKMGNVPKEGFEELVVGREKEIEMFNKELTYVKKGGGSTKFIKGDYGSGKTFLTKTVRELAWKQNFVVSFVELGRGVQFNKLENIYNKIVDGMRTGDYQDIPAFEYILQDWLNRLEESTRYQEKLNPLDPEDRKKLTRIIDRKIETVLQNVGAYNSSFVNVIRGYYHASKERRNQVRSAAIGWLRGEKNIPSRLKKEFNIKGSIDKENVISFLDAIIQLIAEIDNAGLLVIIDEAELIANIARRDFRNDAYENLRRIVDATSNQELNHVLFIFTATELFFEDEERGIPSYQALYQRIHSLKRKDYKDLRVPIVSLDGLNKEQLINISYKIREIHSKVYDWDASARLNDYLLKKLINQMTNRFNQEIKTLPRNFLKVLVDELDLLEQNSDYDLEKSLDKTINKIEELGKDELGDSHVI